MVDPRGEEIEGLQDHPIYTLQEKEDHEGYVSMQDLNGNMLHDTLLPRLKK